MIIFLVGDSTVGIRTCPFPRNENQRGVQKLKTIRTQVQDEGVLINEHIIVAIGVGLTDSLSRYSAYRRRTSYLWAI